ncbi:protein TonB [Pseudomonas duriflava]|uniref:Protein TonB n=1 Tax=Pseudomonas duriflava TaxID=459528 RepID=A0A562Q731_9PSED|nr:energy transducer TonB [Pseudomonas duriflava]TWI52539.1 protein TonB [Pseudomonas duriflava]
MTTATFAAERLLPAGVALAVHGVVITALILGLKPTLPPLPMPSPMQTTLVQLPPEPAPTEAPVREPVAAPRPQPDIARPVPVPPPVDEALLARRRTEAKRLDTEKQQRLAERRLAEEKRSREAQRLKARQLARQHEADVQARTEAERQATDQARLAEARAAREAAERARAHMADTEGASSTINYEPLVKKAPVYPERALGKRLEGDCTVEYTVTAKGTVSQPHIVSGACDDEVFARPSMAAASRFKYQPRIVNGHAVKVTNVRNTFHFRLQN